MFTLIGDARRAASAGALLQHDRRAGDRRRRRSSSCSGWRSSAWCRAAARVADPPAARGRACSARRSSARSSRCPGCRASARRSARCSRWPTVERRRPTGRWCSRVAYCLGLGLPFLAFGLGFRRLIGVFQAVRRNSRWVTRIGGALLILVGLALVTGGWDELPDLAADHRRRRRGRASDDGRRRSDRVATAARPNPALGAAAQLLAAADQHAHRAGAALPAGRRGDPRLGAAAAQRQHRGRRRVLRRRTPTSRRCWTGSGAFDVFASPWFAAIYLLLFTSLIGCVVPRLRDHVRALRAAPPDAPARLDRLPQHAALAGAPAMPAAVAAALRKRRWRGARPDGTVTVSAEKGYLKETGNLLFHFALLAVLVGVGARVVVRLARQPAAGRRPGQAFCNTLQQYDESGLGAAGRRRRPAAVLPGADRLPGRRSWTPGSRSSFAADGPTSRRRRDGAGRTLRGQRPAAARRRQRLPARARVRAGPALHRPVRRGRRPRSAPFLPVDGDADQRGRRRRSRTPTSTRKTGARDPTLQVAFEGLYLPTAPDAAAVRPLGLSRPSASRR